MKAIKLFDTVALRQADSVHGLAAGAVGAVVEFLDAGYVEVEFADVGRLDNAQCPAFNPADVPIPHIAKACRRSSCSKALAMR